MDLKLIVLGIVGIGIKILLIPGYFSTDFDVHHNWLRITYQKPLSEWYYDDVSKWTLDYPPFFAYFEYILALISKLFDPTITTLSVTASVLYFQRFTVILQDIPFLLVLYHIFSKSVTFPLIFSYLFLPLIILDNIHFQYNIMLQTLLLASVYFLIRKQNYLIAAAIYSTLLNFKHIYLYCSIAFFVIILKNYVLKDNKEQNQNKQKVVRLLKVAIVTILPFVLSFAPFLYAGGLQGIGQIFARLFPFGRGLIHDYWAPNFWALYYFADKILSFVLKFLFSYNPLTVASTSLHKPLNQLKVLPQPSANFTLLIILACLIPLILYSIKSKRINSLSTIMISGLVFFMFGYHVHEKAITPYLHLLYVFVASQNLIQSPNNCKNTQKHNKLARLEYQHKLYQNHTQTLQLYCMVFFNILNLFPLLIDIEEKPLKIIIALSYWFIAQGKLNQQSQHYNEQKKGNASKTLYSVLLDFCLFMVLLCQIILPSFNWINGNKLSFLPLMVNSVVCALVNFLWTAQMYYKTVKSQDINQI